MIYQTIRREFVIATTATFCLFGLVAGTQATMAQAQGGSVTSGTLTISGAYVEATALGPATSAPTASAMSGMVMTPIATMAMGDMGGMVMTPIATMAMGDMGGMVMTPAATMAMGDMSGMNMNGPTTAVYMTISNSGSQPDKLLSASANVSQSATLHQTVVKNDIAQMIDLPGGIDVPANGKVSLQPGGYHIMLEGLKQDLIPGGAINLTLTFQSGTVISLQVPIKQM